MQKKILIALLFLSCYPFLFASASDNFLTVSDHWLRAAPPNAMMLAAYAKLSNNTGTDKILIGAASPDFAMVEIHKSVIIDGIASMVHQPELIIKKGETLTLQPGGLHIMLMHPKSPVKAGDSIKICLIYTQDGIEVIQHVIFPVEKK
ncbi:hypothetical protein MNBD_GAMMA01-1782 [hydrothermal vent metagenome]|uniref:Copper metallochaperone, bacterial analog of Cox17 protein n=1 Tax=hydrothermal vent metagenome TaxID=652676 RepID=A0A3B0V3P6_9ZZZZ